MAGGTGGCRPDNLRCHQWRRGWRRGGSQNSVAYWLINVRLWLDKQLDWGPGDAVITLVMPALLWLVAPGVVALTTYGVISGGVVGVVVALRIQWPIDLLMCGCKQGKLVTGRYRENIVDAGFVMAGGTGGCRPDKLRCHQWRCGRRRGDSQFSLFLPLIVTLTIVQCSYMSIIFN